jgi:2-polyprenyl-3-methyl-5-hydroxy-6-metoxy-1,4-benzoquinol methylase
MERRRVRIRCGDGTLAAEIQRSGATVVGVDASDEMVRAARNSQSDGWVADYVRLRFRADKPIEV